MTKKNNPRKKPTKKVLNISANLNNAIYTSTGGDILCLPEDTIRRVLHEQKDKITKNTNWVGLLCMTITLWMVPFTASFHSVLGVKTDNIKAVFTALCLVFSFWTVRSMFSAYKSRSKDVVGEIISKLKEQAQRM